MQVDKARGEAKTETEGSGTCSGASSDQGQGSTAGVTPATASHS